MDINTVFSGYKKMCRRYHVKHAFIMLDTHTPEKKILQNIKYCVINQKCHYIQLLALCDATGTFFCVQEIV